MFPVRGVCRLLVAGGCVSAVAYWLLADTVRRYSADPTDDCLRFAHFGGYEDHELWRDIISAYQAGEHGACVKQEYVVGFGGHYEAKLRQQILSRTMPDVAVVQLVPFHELGERFADLSRLLSEPHEGGPPPRDTLYQDAVRAFERNGRSFGIPLCGGTLLVYCNASAFEAASRYRGRPVALPGRDWTMEQFRQTAADLTCDFDHDGRIDQFGFWLPRWIYYLPFLWSFGAELTDAEMLSWTLKGQEAVEALDFYRSLVLDIRGCPTSEDLPELFQDTAFLTGKIGMCVNGPWFQPFLAHTSLGTRYVVAPIPRGPMGRFTRLTWDGVAMAPDLPPSRRDAASRFVRYLLSAHVQDKIAATGRAIPARINSVAAFIEGAANGQSPGRDSQAPLDARSRRRRATFVESLSYARTQPVFPHFAAVDRAINRYLSLLVDSTASYSPRTMIDELARDAAIRAAFPFDGFEP